MMNRREAMIRLGMLAASGLASGPLNAAAKQSVHLSLTLSPAAFRTCQITTR